MIAIIFEVWPKDDQKAAYLDMAVEMRALLEGMDGFMSVERFESITEPGKLLSLSFWRDEAAVENWRKLAAHRKAQAAGRGIMFRDYRLRVAEVLRDYGMTERAQTPEDSREMHG